MNQSGNDLLARVLDYDALVTAISLGGAAGAVISVVVGFRLVTAVVWAIGA